MKETDPLDVLTNPYREEEKRKIYERAVEKANKDQALYTVLAKLTENELLHMKPCITCGKLTKNHFMSRYFCEEHYQLPQTDEAIRDFMLKYPL